MTEAEITREVIRKLNREPHTYCWKVHGGPMQNKGISDIIGVYRGKLFAIEMKKPGKESTLTELQAVFLERIRQAGGRAGVATNYKQSAGIVYG